MDKQSCILVTGAGGVLGAGLLTALKDEGYENVFAPSRKELDLLDKDKVLDFFATNKPDYVFHLASVVYGLRGNDINQWKSLTVNTDINQNVFTAIENVGVKKIFFASTVAAYPDGATTPLREEDFFQDFLTLGNSDMLCRNGMPLAISNCSKRSEGYHIHMEYLPISSE